jgi:hypothetical protein
MICELQFAFPEEKLFLFYRLGLTHLSLKSPLRNYLKRLQRVIPDLIRSLPAASNAIFGEILNRVQDDLPVLR